MKSKLLMFIATLVAGTGASVMQAQYVDVTNTYLQNAGFNESILYGATSTGNLESANLGTNIKNVQGWSIKVYGNNSAAATFTFACPMQLNGYSVPTVDENGKAEGGVLGISAAWSANNYYGQNVTLSPGKYKLTYAAYNSGPNASNKSLVGWHPTEGTAVTSPKTSFTQNEWSTETLSFSVMKETTGEIRVGIGAGNVGSGGVGRIFFDYVKLECDFSVDKTDLNTAISNAQTLYGSGTGQESAALNTAILAAQAVANNDLATLVEVNQAISDLNAAIFSYKVANATDQNPLNVTSFITNATVTNNNGWLGDNNTNSGEQYPGAPDNTYLDKWNGSAYSYNVYQNLTGVPNGKYKLIVAARSNSDVFSVYGETATKKTTPIINNGNSGGALGNGWNDITVSDIIVLNNTIKIGVSGQAPANVWVGSDNFRLYYCGVDLEPILADLQAKIDEAEAITDVMQKSVATALNDAITTGKSNLTSTDIPTLESSITSLNEAIKAANVSIAEYVKLQKAIDLANSYKTTFTTPSTEAKNAFQTAIDVANSVWTEAIVAETAEAVATLKNACMVYISSVETPSSLTSLIADADFENGRAGWITDQNSTGGWNEGISNDANGDGSNYYWYGFPGRMHHAGISQTIDLPAGRYTLTANVCSEPIGPDQTFLYATTSATNVWGEFFTGYYQSASVNQDNVWETLSIDFELTQNSKVWLGILSKGANQDANKKGWYRADNFTLTYKGNGSIVTSENKVTVKGNADLTEVNTTLTAEITSLDVTEASITGEINPTNPNIIVYGLPAGATLKKGISEGGNSALDEMYAFHAPAPLEATISYTRAFNMNGAPCNQTNGNWQTICLPFDVTAVKATQSGNEISLIPISGFTGTEGTNDPRPFWVYEIGIDNKLNPATEMKANVPYLVAIPNDASTYRDFYNVSGDVVFSGTQILVTNPETGNTDTYSMTANFTPIAANTNDYGINAEGTYFVPSVDINSFNAKVTPVGTGKPAYLSIFGDEPDVTALPSIPSAELQNGIEVYTTSNGITIQSEKETFLSIFAVTGKLVKEIRINEGLNYVTLPIGQYVINGSVIIVK